MDGGAHYWGVGVDLALVYLSLVMGFKTLLVCSFVCLYTFSPEKQGMIKVPNPNPPHANIFQTKPLQLSPSTYRAS